MDRTSLINNPYQITPCLNLHLNKSNNRYILCNSKYYCCRCNSNRPFYNQEWSLQGTTACINKLRWQIRISLIIERYPTPRQLILPIIVWIGLHRIPTITQMFPLLIAPTSPTQPKTTKTCNKQSKASNWVVSVRILVAKIGKKPRKR